MKFLHFFCILLITVFVISCSKKPAEEKKTGNTPTTNSVPVKYKEKDLTKTFKGCKPEDKNCTYIKLKWIELTDTKFKDTINYIIDRQILGAYTLDSNTKYTDMKSMSIAFIDAFTAFKKKEPSSTANWFINYNVSVYYSNAKILCLKFEMTNFEGGAHELHTVKFMNLNLATGKSFGISNLLKKDFDKSLNSLIEKKFRVNKNLTEKDSLTKAGLFKNEIKYNDNFAVTNDGLEFYYNDTEIAPHVAGEIVIKLSYEEIAELISDDSLLK